MACGRGVLCLPVGYRGIRWWATAWGTTRGEGRKEGRHPDNLLTSCIAGKIVFRIIPILICKKWFKKMFFTKLKSENFKNTVEKRKSYWRLNYELLNVFSGIIDFILLEDCVLDNTFSEIQFWPYFLLQLKLIIVKSVNYRFLGDWHQLFLLAGVLNFKIMSIMPNLEQPVDTRIRS